MPLFYCSYDSKALATPHKVAVLLPGPDSMETASRSLEELYAPRGPLQVLYLLHGMNEDESTWLRRTTIEQYARRLRLALVMPYGENSFYLDMACGPAWLENLTEELPRFLRQNFALSPRREDTAIAGASMGGYGALHAALLRPDLFGAAASLSGALDLEQVVRRGHIFGLVRQGAPLVGSAQKVPGSENDLFACARRQTAQPLPRLYLCCGRQDAECLEMNRRFAAHLAALGLAHVYEEFDGGHHWPEWERQIPAMLKHLFSPDKGA